MTYNIKGESKDVHSSFYYHVTCYQYGYLSQRTGILKQATIENGEYPRNKQRTSRDEQTAEQNSKNHIITDDVHFQQCGNEWLYHVYLINIREARLVTK